MGCGSSRRLRAVTPIHESDKMVLPLAWITHAKESQTDGLTFDPAPPAPWDTRTVETQTPTDDCFDSLDLMLAKADHLWMGQLKGGGEKVQSSEASVQTHLPVSDQSTQTEIPSPAKETTAEEERFILAGKEDEDEPELSARKLMEIEDEIVEMTSKMLSIESQTEPVNKAMAANSADSEAAGMSELLSPFAHLEKEMTGRRDLPQDALARLLADVEDSLGRRPSIEYALLRAPCREVAVQTDNDPITDEAPEYAARPPPCKKLEMIPDSGVFEEIDNHAIQAPEGAKSSLRNLVNYLNSNAQNELLKVRAYFRWIANNMTYDWKYMDVKLGIDDVLQKCEGVCKDYCKLFGEMCNLSNIRVKRVHGFAKGYDYRPGHQFHPGEDISHAWNAVFVFGAWRLVDVTWGTGYTDHTGKFQRKLNEHFFLTDPEVLIWTHFPYSEMESNYSRWQLLDKPLKLDEFNALPKVTPFFFEYHLRIRSRPQNPVVFRVQTELKLASHKPMRYKYKLYSVEERENGSLNCHAFCQLKEDRLLGSFAVAPPQEGMYYFKIYARPEWQMYEDTTLKNVAIFLLECVKARKQLNPYPANDVPWGPTQSFFDYRMKLINQIGPVIVTWGGKRKLTLETVEHMLLTQQVFDASGKELDHKSILQREDTDRRVSLTVTPPRVGLYKLLVFGMPKPRVKGKWKLPLLASFLIDCKLCKVPGEDDPYNKDNKKDNKKKKRMKVPTVR